MRKLISLIFKFYLYANAMLYNKFCLLILLFKLFLLNIPHGKIKTGGGIIKISLSRKGHIILGDNVNFANRWEIGYPSKCYLRIRGNGLLSIGNNTGLNSVSVFCDQKIIIGNNVNIGGNTKIFDANFYSNDNIERMDTNSITNSRTLSLFLGPLFKLSRC